VEAWEPHGRIGRLNAGPMLPLVVPAFLRHRGSALPLPVWRSGGGHAMVGGGFFDSCREKRGML